MSLNTSYLSSMFSMHSVCKQYYDISVRQKYLQITDLVVRSKEAGRNRMPSCASR